MKIPFYASATTNVSEAFLGRQSVSASLRMVVPPKTKFVSI